MNILKFFIFMIPFLCSCIVSESSDTDDSDLPRTVSKSEIDLPSYSIRGNLSGKITIHESENGCKTYSINLYNYYSDDPVNHLGIKMAQLRSFGSHIESNTLLKTGSVSLCNDRNKVYSELYISNFPGIEEDLLLKECNFNLNHIYLDDYSLGNSKIGISMNLTANGCLISRLSDIYNSKWYDDSVLNSVDSVGKVDISIDVSSFVECTKYSDKGKFGIVEFKPEFINGMILCN